MRPRYIDRSSTIRKENKTIEIFLDKLQMSHVIDSTGRLEIHPPTIPFADLLLQKLQIVKTKEKDIEDAMILLSEHDIGRGNKEQVKDEYIAESLANECRFHYTVSEHLEEFIDKHDLNKQDNQAASKRIDLFQETTKK